MCDELRMDAPAVSPSASYLAAPHPGSTVADLAYDRIRTDILFGRLAPSQRLRLDSVSRSYGTSIGTLRELLNRLAADGLIVAEGQRGFQVAPVSPAGFREVGAMRLLLETHAMTQSFGAGDLDWEAGVVAAHHKLAVMEAAMLEGRGDAQQWKQSDRAFHHALIAACGSRLLLESCAAIYDKYLRYLMVAVVFRGNAAVQEHRVLRDCALARDVGRAHDILVEHVEGCISHALTQNPTAFAARARLGERLSK